MALFDVDRDAGKSRWLTSRHRHSVQARPASYPCSGGRKLGAGMHMWLMKNSVKIVKLFLFMPPRKVHCFTETMGKEEGKKKGIGLPNIHVADVKEAPPRLTFCVGAGGQIHLCNVNFNPCTPEGTTM